MPTPAQGKTRTVTVNTATPTVLTALTYCDWVEVGEDPSVTNYPTTDFRVYKPDSGSVPRQLSRGAIYAFLGPFGPNEKLGEVIAVNATSTFFIDEHTGRKRMRI